METIQEYPNKRSTTQATSTVSETERMLSKLGHGYKRAKAQQILRLLKDQESLNQRFRDCALNDDDENNDDDDDDGSDGQDSLAGNVGDSSAALVNHKRSPKKTNTSDVLKWVAAKVDPSRCRTSMGFYNEAECSGSVDGDDVDGISEFEAETDAAILEEREAMFGRLSNGNNLGNTKSRRLFRLQLDENDTLMEEGTIQSARSSRPKTGIASSSAKSKQYRRPTQAIDTSTKAKPNPTVSTSVSKLDGSMTPRGGVRGFCENSQDALLQLTPRFNDMAGSFTPRMDDANPCFTPRGFDGHARRQYNDLPAYLTPRQSETLNSMTPRQSEAARHTEAMTTPRASNQHRTVVNFYSSQLTPRDDFAQYATSPRFDETAGIVTPRTYHGMKQGRCVDKKMFDASSQPFNDASKIKRTGVINSYAKSGAALVSTGVRTPRSVLAVDVPTTPRSRLSVDQSPIHVIPTSCQEGEITPRRQKHESKAKKRADIQRTGGHQNLSKLSERVQPISMMKLPPLDVTLNKPVIS